jgi:hypothetical protein
VATTGITIRVKGLNELDRAFKRMDKDLRQDFVHELQEAADQPRKLAEQKILGELSNMPRTPIYSRQKVGVSAKTTVYIAPAWRRGGGSPRPNLSGAMRNRMEGAVDEKASAVESDIGGMLDRMSNEWGE